MVIPEDIIQDREQVVPVSDLKVTISQMLKEALEEYGAKLNTRIGENRKGRVTRLSLFMQSSYKKPA